MFLHWQCAKRTSPCKIPPAQSYIYTMASSEQLARFAARISTATTGANFLLEHVGQRRSEADANMRTITLSSAYTHQSCMHNVEADTPLICLKSDWRLHTAPLSDPIAS